MTEQQTNNASVNIESVNPNLLIEQLSDLIWKMADSWSDYAKTTIGINLVKIVDEIGLQLTLTQGYNQVKDYLRRLSNARKGLMPADYYLQRAFKRGLITQADAEILRGQLVLLAQWIDNRLQSVVKEANQKAAEQKQQQEQDQNAKGKAKAKSKAEQSKSSIEFEAESSTAH